MFLVSQPSLSLRRVVALYFDIVVPLSVHPDQGGGSNNGGSSKTLAPSCRSKDQPFGHEVCKGNDICPEGQLVHRLSVDVVGGVQTDNGSDCGPGAKSAS